MSLALAALLSAVGFYLSTGLGEVWPLAWLAPVPLLLVSNRSRPVVAFGAAAVAWFLGSLNLFSFLSRVMPAPIVLTLLIAPGIVFGLAPPGESVRSPARSPFLSRGRRTNFSCRSPRRTARRSASATRKCRG